MTQKTDIHLHYQAKEDLHIEVLLDGQTIFGGLLSEPAMMPPILFSKEVAAPGTHTLLVKDPRRDDMEGSFTTPEDASVLIRIEEDPKENSFFVSSEDVAFK